MAPLSTTAVLGRAALRSCCLRREEARLIRSSARAFSTSTSTSTSTSIRTSRQVGRPSKSLQPSRPITHSRSPQTTTPRLETNNRPYHSSSHPPPPGPFSPAELTILSAAYVHVPTHGFTSHSLALGARDAGYLDISATLLPNGPFDLIRYHLLVRREALVSVALDPDTKTTDRVSALTWERLLGNAPVLHVWQEALAVMAQPSHVPGSVRELAQLADDIWFLAGDRGVDPSWYSKRAGLAAVYVSAELFMTNDASAGFADTRAFLTRRFDEVGEFGGVVKSVGEWLSFTAGAGVNVLRSKGVRI